jgi:hypothetical protein
MPFTAIRMVPLLLAVLALVGCSDGATPYQILRAYSITVYEGLPHQSYEGQLLAAEIKAKPTVTLHDFPFYEETLSIDKEDEAKLIAILGDSANFKIAGLVKKCGGFHPEFAVKWNTKAGENMGLICFGCGEYQIFGNGLMRKYDMDGGCHEELREILAAYRKNRPVHVDWGQQVPLPNNNLP